MSSLAEAIKKRQKEAEDMEMLEKLGAAMDKVKPPRVQPRVQRTPKKKQTITIEIDFTALEEHICLNHDIKGFNNEAKLFKAFFGNSNISGYHRPYGRQQYLWNAMKEVMTKQAKKIVRDIKGIV